MGIADANHARADEIAAAAGTRAFHDAHDLLGQVDAVTIAVPTESHHAVARPFLERGVATLVEKPMTRTLEEADDLIALAAATRRRRSPSVTPSDSTRP